MCIWELYNYIYIYILYIYTHTYSYQLVCKARKITGGHHLAWLDYGFGQGKYDESINHLSDLQAGGFQMYNQETGEPIGNPMEYIRDGLRFGKLSGGQQHLIYILRRAELQDFKGRFKMKTLVVFDQCSMNSLCPNIPGQENVVYYHLHALCCFSR